PVPVGPACVVTSRQSVLLASSLARRQLPSFPTRRSSDLVAACPPRSRRRVRGARPAADHSVGVGRDHPRGGAGANYRRRSDQHPDRKSTRLNSSHVKISYAVFCLKKKNKRNKVRTARFCR